MAYDIVLGRKPSDVDKYGIKASVFLGKHYVKMGQTTALSNKIYLDVNSSHVVFVCGKRGGGKSYTMGAIAEGMAELDAETAQQLCVVMLDTMGVYWTMKYPNHQDESLLKEWGLEGHGINVKIYTPAGYYKDYKEKGIPTDVPFSINPSELGPEDWFLTFDILPTSPVGVFIERLILTLKEEKDTYGVDEIVDAIRADTKEEPHIKQAAENRFAAVAKWGIFSKKATLLSELVKPGQITVLDLSPYAVMANGWKIKCLVIGLVSQKLFVERMAARRVEENESIHSATHYFEREKEGSRLPLVWLIIDEAHEFLPKDGMTAATGALLTLLREGRQPGVSLILATQQPGKIHTDVMTQSDVIIGHRLTAKIDIEALGALVQTYLRLGIDRELDNLPRTSGAAVVMDDLNERLYPMQVRPRLSWHGGGTPGILKEKKKILEF